MISKKSIDSTVAGTVFLSALIAPPAISASGSVLTAQVSNENFMLAQAHEHDEDKGEKSKHKKDDHKKSNHDNKHGGKDKDYAQLIVSHADALALSDAQLGKVTRIHLKYTTENKKAKQEAHKNMQAFIKASMKPGTSEAKLRELGAAHAEAFNVLVEQHIDERKAVHDVLTDEQITKLKSIKIPHDEHDDNHESGHDHH